MRDGVVMHTLKRWEIALLLALAFTLLWGAASVQRQERLAEKVIRLHVIAHSDTRRDQAIKLQIRDKVIDFTNKLLQGIEDRGDAENVLRSALPELENIANAELEKAGCSYRAKALLEKAEFPRKTYGGFALPAGEYLALRLVIGEGKGHNWWCVVYPALCTAACSEKPQTVAAAGFSDAERALMTRENNGVILKFRSVELWQQLRRALGK